MSIKYFTWIVLGKLRLFMISISSKLSFGGNVSCQFWVELGVAKRDEEGGVSVACAAGTVGAVCKLLHLVQRARMRAHVGEVRSVSPSGRECKAA